MRSTLNKKIPSKLATRTVQSRTAGGTRSGRIGSSGVWLRRESQRTSVKRRASTTVIGWSSHTKPQHERNAHEAHYKTNYRKQTGGYTLAGRNPSANGWRQSGHAHRQRNARLHDSLSPIFDWNRPKERITSDGNVFNRVACLAASSSITPPCVTAYAVSGAPGNSSSAGKLFASKFRCTEQSAETLDLIIDSPFERPRTFPDAQEITVRSRPLICQSAQHREIPLRGLLIQLRPYLLPIIRAQFLPGHLLSNDLLDSRTKLRGCYAIGTVDPIPHMRLRDRLCGQLRQFNCQLGLSASQLSSFFEWSVHAQTIKQLFSIGQYICCLFYNNGCFTVRKWH